MEDIYYSKYIKYKIKYLNLRETQTGGGVFDLFSGFFSSKTSQSNLNKSIQVPQSEIERTKKFMTLISNYNALVPTVTDISKKIKTVSSKITYFIITESMIESLHVYIKSINDTIITRIQLLQYMKDNKETFEERFQKLYNDLNKALMDIKQILNDIESTITNTPENIMFNKLVKSPNVVKHNKIVTQIDKLKDEMTKI